jgi:hypothetical protein
VAALLEKRFREGRGARAVVHFEVGQIDFEFMGDDGEWRSFFTLKGERLPELRPN